MPKRKRSENGDFKELHVNKTSGAESETKENESGVKRRKKRIVKDKEEENVEEVKVSKKKVIVEGISEEQAYLRDTEGARVLAEAGTSKKMLGAHVSAAGSLEQAIYNAVSIGCRAFALFVRNQRRWDSPPLDEDVVLRWHNVIKEYSFPLDQIIPHGSYLMNSGSHDATILEKTRAALLDECQRCERLGILAYNFHPGSTSNKCTRDECIQTIAETINYIIDKTKFITLVVEAMAGQGTTIGGKFEDLREIIDQVKDKSRVGVCLDTCHIFAAGYDIRTNETYEETMKEFERIVGLGYLKAVHLNDSKGALGSKLDRHENIGKGHLKSAFQWIMRDPRLDGIPMVLETPEGHYSHEMKLLYKMEKNEGRVKKELE